MQFSRLDPGDLLFALELARANNLGDAARRLRIDQTTLSRRIGRLENQAGARLFSRARGSWDLTDAGRRLIPYAEGIESNVIAAGDFARAGSGPLTGTVRIITTDGFGVFVLIPGFADFRARHPDVYLEVETQTGRGLMTGRDFDIAVTLERPHNAGLRVEHLARYELGLYASREYLLQRGTPETLDSLRRDHPIIWYIDALLEVQPLRSIESDLLGARAHIQTNNIAAHLQAAVSGLGVAPLPRYIAGNDDRLVRVLDTEFAVMRSYWLVVPTVYSSLARIEATVHALRATTRANQFLSPL